MLAVFCLHGPPAKLCSRLLCAGQVPILSGETIPRNVNSCFYMLHLLARQCLRRQIRFCSSLLVNSMVVNRQVALRSAPLVAHLAHSHPSDWWQILNAWQECFGPAFFSCSPLWGFLSVMSRREHAWHLFNMGSMSAGYKLASVNRQTLL